MDTTQTRRRLDQAKELVKGGESIEGTVARLSLSESEARALVSYFSVKIDG